MTTEKNLPARVGRLKRDLAEAKTLPEIRGVMASAKALKRMTKGVAKALDAHNEAAIVVIEAMVREGEALSTMAKATGTRGQLAGRDLSGGPAVIPPEAKAATLEELGISKTEAWQCQRLASIPEATRQGYYLEAKAARQEITIAAALRLAAPEPEVSDLIPPKVTTIKAPARTVTLDVETVQQEPQRVSLSSFNTRPVERGGPMLTWGHGAPLEQERPGPKFGGPKATTQDEWRTEQGLASLYELEWLLQDLELAARRVLDSSEDVRAKVQASIGRVVKLKEALRTERARRDAVERFRQQEE